MVSLYYDPLLDVHHKLPVLVAIINALYLAPLRPLDAQRLFEAGVGMMGVVGDGPPAVIGERSTGVALLLAREWGLDDLASRLAAGADASYEPTWNASRGEFTWGFGLNEEHPRGQFNAIMAAADAMTPGAWTALANDARGPTSPGLVVGVDFPTVAMAQAEWIGGELHTVTAPMNDVVVGSATSWRVAGLDDATRWQATADGGVVATRVENGDLVIDTTVDARRYKVTQRPHRAGR